MSHLVYAHDTIIMASHIYLYCVMWHLVHAPIVHNGIMYNYFVCHYVAVYGLLTLCDISYVHTMLHYGTYYILVLRNVSSYTCCYCA